MFVAFKNTDCHLAADMMHWGSSGWASCIVNWRSLIEYALLAKQNVEFVEIWITSVTDILLSDSTPKRGSFSSYQAAPRMIPLIREPLSQKSIKDSGEGNRGGVEPKGKLFKVKKKKEGNTSTEPLTRRSSSVESHFKASGANWIYNELVLRGPSFE